ncbi:MarR family transcriptional regulator [Salinisphaera sp. USBA-960]|nr:MarR family transcriptional regulator [Salifodinibacter halophilus]NNC27017.1 MarR family transcriptional regulator [Salifodinibacter halophilus]
MSESDRDNTTDNFPNLALEDQLCLALCRGARSITRLYTERLADLGITHPQYLVLLALYAEECLTAGAIAERICLDPSSVTPILKKMEESSLIERERPINNQRQLLVRLTSHGAALKSAVADVQSNLARATGLTRTEMIDLCGQLRTVADRLDAADRPED